MWSTKYIIKIQPKEMIDHAQGLLLKYKQFGYFPLFLIFKNQVAQSTLIAHIVNLVLPGFRVFIKKQQGRTGEMSKVAFQSHLFFFLNWIILSLFLIGHSLLFALSPPKPRPPSHTPWEELGPQLRVTGPTSVPRPQGIVFLGSDQPTSFTYDLEFLLSLTET